MNLLEKLFHPFMKKEIHQTVIPNKCKSIFDYPLEYKVKKMYLGIPPTLKETETQQKIDEEKPTADRICTETNTETILINQKYTPKIPKMNKQNGEFKDNSNKRFIYDVDFIEIPENETENYEEIPELEKNMNHEVSLVYSKLSDNPTQQTEKQHETKDTQGNSVDISNENPQNNQPKIKFQENQQTNQDNAKSVHFVFRKESFTFK